MIHLDTSVLIDAFAEPGATREHMGEAGARVRLLVSTLVLYEWWRGPRTEAQLRAQSLVLPVERAVVFDAPTAVRAAVLCRSIRRPRSREMDIAIAACAIEHDAALWTLNPEDFRDIPGLRLYTPTIR